jgi:hypothetical protein
MIGLQEQHQLHGGNLKSDRIELPLSTNIGLIIRSVLLKIEYLQFIIRIRFRIVF